MTLENIISRIYTQRAIRVALHFLFWILLSAVQWYLSSISFNPYSAFPLPDFILYLLSGTVGIVLFYYPFVYYVLPRLISRKKLIPGILYLLGLIVFYSLYDVAREEYVLKSCSSCIEDLKATGSGYYDFLQAPLFSRWLAKVISMGTFIGLLFSITFPLSIKLGLQAFRQQLRSVQLERDNLRLEFDFLRSQINPHFLFNTLNNIYGQILNNEKERSANLVARLSQVLRYTLYESGNTTAPIEKEVQVLQDYIDLESVRVNHIKVNFEYKTDGSVTVIAPLLMVPVIENAFKYCADIKGGYINIDFVVENKQLHVCLKNSVDPDLQSASGGGIGQSNFIKRLQLYYPGKHKYTVTNSGNEYMVSVNIDCHE